MNTAVQTIVGVRFRPAGRIYYFDSCDFDLKTGTFVVVETSRGIEAGRVVINPKQIQASQLKEGLKPVIRIATDDDLRQMLSYKAKEKEVLVKSNSFVTQHNLPMKLVEAEYSFDGSKLTVYFTAEDRVDFRLLVRDLASAFHTRIELRQIGARDHAKMLGGVGVCGKTLCCSSWLTDFNVVSIKMAKEQGLSLNPSKISGVCGRLMCCLAYENDQYVAAKAGMPTIGDYISTPNGNGKIVGINVPNETVEVMLESGAVVHVPVTQTEHMRRAPVDARRHAGACGTGSCTCPTAPGNAVSSEEQENNNVDENVVQDK